MGAEGLNLNIINFKRIYKSRDLLNLFNDRSYKITNTVFVIFTCGKNILSLLILHKKKSLSNKEKKEEKEIQAIPFSFYNYIHQNVVFVCDSI